MIRGTLIAESLQLNAALEGVPLFVAKVTRVGPIGDRPDRQPSVWTLIEFTADDSLAAALAGALADVLDLGPWYCDFRTDDETFVVFAGRVFHYRRGDADGRAGAAAHARRVGIPDTQIDWPE